MPPDPRALNGHRPVQDLAADDVFTVNTPSGVTIPVRELSDLELCLALESFDYRLHQLIAIDAVQHRDLPSKRLVQALIDTARMDGMLAYERDRRGRISKRR